MPSHEPALFDNQPIRRVYDASSDTWWFSVVDIIKVLTHQSDTKRAGLYWRVLKSRLAKEGSQTVTECNALKLTAEDGKERLTDCATAETMLTNVIHQEWTGLSIKEHKERKGLKSQNLRDHMTEAELIFTALAELSTRQVAQTNSARGMPANQKAALTGGSIAKRARLELEKETGGKVVSDQNYLPPPRKQKSLK